MGGHGKAVVSGEDGRFAELNTPGGDGGGGLSAGGRRRGKNHKQKHIGSVIKHFKESGMSLSPGEIFLIDDDPINCEAARQHGMRSSRFDDLHLTYINVL